MYGPHRDVPPRSPHKDLLPSLQGVWLPDSLQLTASESASATENKLTQGHVLPRADLFQPQSKVRDRETTLTWDSSEGQLLQNFPTCWPTLWQICISLTFPWAQSCFLLILSQVFIPNKHLGAPNFISVPAPREPPLRRLCGYVLLVYFSTQLPGWAERSLKTGKISFSCRFPAASKW